jgi:predicted nucleic acid-binding protein
MPVDRFFVDTNLILYSVDPRDPVKRDRSRMWLAALWESGAGRLSWQVLHEFYANAQKSIGTDPERAREMVALFHKWQPGEMTIGLIERGWYWMDEAQLSYWDSLILASAERLGCRWLVSEDFAAGRRFEGVTVVNPFQGPPADYGLPSSV